MTISTEVRKAGPFIGNDSASVFPFAFKVFKAADLIVVRRQDNIGTETPLVLDSDYHVTLNGNQDTTPGGVVTLVAGVLASGFTLVVSSELPYLQTTDLTNQGGFYPKVITNALDRLTIFCQQLLEITGRTLKLPITAPTNISAEIPLPNPSELIAWNETGTGLTTISPQSLVTSIAYGSATADLFAGDGVTTTFPLTTNPASVNNLDVSIGGYSQRPVQDGVGDYSWNGGASITFVVPPPAPTVPGDKNVLVRYMQAIPVSDSEALHAQTREALRRSYAEAGLNLVAGSFETGGTLTAATDVLLQESKGAAYGWTGALPKVVAPGFDPVGVVGFELRSTEALRAQISANNCINAGLYGLSPSNTSAQNTAVMNTVNALSASTGKPVYFPPIGLCKIGRMSDVSGVLRWVTDGGCTLQADGDNWPWATTSLPLLRVNGSFSVEGKLTLDQNWIQDEGRGYPGSYNDGKNPRTWGGYWMFEVHGGTSSKLELESIEWKNVYRGAVAFNTDRINAGFGKVSMVHCSGESKAAVSQTILAAEDPMLFHVSDNPDIICTRWDEGPAYISNGVSVVFPWGGENIRLLDNGFDGYQLVCRGPKTLSWEANKSYNTTEEFRAPNGDSYAVIASYTSGATFGATEINGTNVQKLWNPQKKLSMVGCTLQSPVADTAIYGWRDVVIVGNQVFDSGDMGFAVSASGTLNISGNIVERVRNGAYDLTGWDQGGIVNCFGNIAIDWARGSDGVFSRIDTLNPGIYASNAGFGLAAFTVGLQTGSGTKQVNIHGNNAYMETLPPVSDPNGPVRARTLGYYSQISANEAAFNTINFGGNFCQDLEGAMPGMFINIPEHKFYCSAITGTPQPGEIFSAFNGGVKFVLCAAIGAGSRVFVRKFKGALLPAGGMVFTGSRSGATITVAGNPQFDILGSDEGQNVDYTSKYIDTNGDKSLIGFATVDPLSVANGATIYFTIPVSGAAVGDFVMVAPPYQIQGLELTAYVSNISEVNVILRNGTGAAIDLASGVWKARVIKG